MLAKIKRIWNQDKTSVFVFLTLGWLVGVALYQLGMVPVFISNFIGKLTGINKTK